MLTPTFNISMISIIFINKVTVTISTKVLLRKIYLIYLLIRHVFSLFHMNIRSIFKNMGDLELCLNSINHNFTLIGMSETWLNCSTAEVVNIAAYKHEYDYRNNRMGGGVSLLIQDNLEYRFRNDLTTITSQNESLFVEKQFSFRCNVIVGVVYRPPNTDVSSFTDILFSILSVCKNETN